MEFVCLDILIENSHSSSGTICMRNRVEVGGTIRNYMELIGISKILDNTP